MKEDFNFQKIDWNDIVCHAAISMIAESDKRDELIKNYHANGSLKIICTIDDHQVNFEGFIRKLYDERDKIIEGAVKDMFKEKYQEAASKFHELTSAFEKFAKYSYPDVFNEED